MRKALIFVLAVSLLIALSSSVIAQPRTNVWASWVNVTSYKGHTMTFPYNSRDIWISNMAASPICVGLKATGTVTGGDCRNSGYSCFQLAGGDSIYLSDYVDSGIVLSKLGFDASPVSVVVTY